MCGDEYAQNCFAHQQRTIIFQTEEVPTDDHKHMSNGNLYGISLLENYHSSVNFSNPTGRFTKKFITFKLLVFELHML